MIEQLMSNRIASLVVLVSVAVGAVVAIAGGFYVTYQIVAIIGN